MQSSECAFNKKYPNTPNGITDPEYSIDVGIQNLTACLREAGVESPVDMNHIKLALQGYNYGNGYISWAKENYGGYTYANAVEFSVMMAEQKWMEQLRRYRVCDSCTSVLCIWTHPCWCWESGNRTGGTDTGRKWGRHLLELVWIFPAGRNGVPVL